MPHPKRMRDRPPGECALATANVVEACTLLSRYRLARGIVFLLVGALSAAGASSLHTSGKRHVSRVYHVLYFLCIQDSISSVRCKVDVCRGRSPIGRPIMSFNTFIRVSEQPPKADKSAMAAINRALRSFACNYFIHPENTQNLTKHRSRGRI